MSFDAAWAALQKRWRVAVILYALGLGFDPSAALAW